MVNTLFENIVDEECPMRGRLFNGVQINKGFVNVSSKIGRESCMERV